MFYYSVLLYLYEKTRFLPLKNYSVNFIDPNPKITLAGSNLKYFPTPQCRILRKNDFKKNFFFEKMEFFKKPPINVRNHFLLHSQNTEISITFERKQKSKFHPGRSLDLSPRVLLTFSIKIFNSPLS